MDNRGNRVAKGNREEAGGKQLFEELEGKGNPRRGKPRRGNPGREKQSRGVVRQGRG
jgi:hypothetical protein